MKIKYWLPFVALLYLQSPVLAERYGSAPFEPSLEDDEHFVLDEAPGALDTGCTYGDGSPLKFQVKVNRYVGPTRTDGTLENIDRLIEQGVISEYAELKMPNYDVDSSAPVNPETDLVYFNGTPIGKLTGVNNAWEMNSFRIPTRLIKFPARRGSNGANGTQVSAPERVENEIRVDIDTTGGGWCAAIDWGQIQFKAMAPLLLIHGTGANPRDAWEVEPGVTNYLTNLGIPFEHNIQLGPNDSIFAPRDRNNNIIGPGNAEALVEHIRNNAASFGVQRVHLVGHSKGGLDSRGYLSRYLPPDEDRVLSLHTLSTPHHGSILADLSVAQREHTTLAILTDNQDVRNFLDSDVLLAGSARVNGFGPRRPALDDLQVKAMAAFNRENTFPSRVKLYTYSADADLDDGCMNLNQPCQITADEARPVVPDNLPDDIASFVGSLQYRILRDVSTIELRRRTYFGFPSYEMILMANPTSTPQRNDILVTNTSANHPSQRRHFGPFNRNHRNMKDPATMDRVLETIRTDFPVN